ncbi:uncharacterized protein LOC142420503 [Mycteria americana]|uniref:uncharacterized protein LOC142420503 n=1 Tax=Mycteria americana TaxID=33587 RepID=UPI003F58EFFB
MTSLWKHRLAGKAYHLIKRTKIRVISSGVGSWESLCPLWEHMSWLTFKEGLRPPCAHRTLGISKRNKSRRTTQRSNSEEKAGELDEITTAAQEKNVPRSRTSKKDRKSRDSKRTIKFSLLIPPLQSQTTVNSLDQGHGTRCCSFTGDASFPPIAATSEAVKGRSTRSPQDQAEAVEVLYLCQAVPVQRTGVKLSTVWLYGSTIWWHQPSPPAPVCSQSGPVAAGTG